jgi:lipoate-protein ligase A
MNALRERSDAKRRDLALTSTISCIASHGALEAMQEEAELFARMARWARPEVRIWHSQERHLVVPRRECADPRFRKAQESVEAFGWSVIVRNTGGTAYPIGPETVQISLVSRITDAALLPFASAYAELCDPILEALHAYGIPVHIGSVQNSLCDGTHNLCAGGLKFAGTSQRRRQLHDGAHTVLINASLAVGNLWVRAAEVATEYYRQLYRPMPVDSASHTSLIECFGCMPDIGLDAWCRWAMELLVTAFSGSCTETRQAVPTTDTQTSPTRTASLS